LMYVNKDGSIGSTSGYVEDRPAASPPDLSPWGQGEPEKEYETDENGNLIDPETGEIIPVDPETGEPIVDGSGETGGAIVIDPTTGETAEPPATENSSGGGTETTPPAETEPEPVVPVTPPVAEPEESIPDEPEIPEPSPEESEAPEFVIIPQ